MKKLVLMFASCGALMFAAPLNPFNTRPVLVGSTVDPAVACTSFGAANCELQSLINFLNVSGGAINVNTDQQSAGMWKLTGAIPVTAPVLAIEVTANQNTQQLGIWSDSNGDTDLAGRTLVDIFLEGATGFGSGTPTVATLAFNLITGNLTIGGGPNVNVGVFAGINVNAFGFYLQPQGSTNSGETFYSVDQLNTNGTAQVLAFRNPTANRWFIGFEDVDRSIGGDKDYNDLILQIESIEPVPEPGFYGVVALGLAGLFWAYRRRQTA